MFWPKKPLFCLIVLLFAGRAYATLGIPGGLTSADEGKILSILGYGSACKILDDPAPLGVYSGLEVGLSSETMSTDQVATLGNKAAASQSQTSIQTLSVGKGVSDNIDAFLQVSFLGQQENVSGIGGQVRWGFYQAQYLPISMTAVVHADTNNFENLIVTTTFGADAIMGVREGNLTLFFGGGLVRSNGQFVGNPSTSVVGTGGITASGAGEAAGISDNRFLAGLNLKLGETFLAFELDRYSLPVYSGKIGMRF